MFFAVQAATDRPADYIRANTGLQMDRLRRENWAVDEVNVVTANLKDLDDIRLYAGPIAANSTDASWLELLRAPGLPRLETLTRRLTDATVTARIEV